MDIASIDPRTGGETISLPVYRVYFWERGTDPQGRPAGYAADEYEITGASDVYEVIAWASSNSGAGAGRIHPGADRTFTLYAVTDRAPLLVRLAGIDPT